MNQINKELLHSLIGQVKTEKVIEELYSIVEKVDKALISQVINQKSKYTDLNRHEINGTLSNDEIFRRRNTINTALLAIIDGLPDKYPTEPEDNTPGMPVSTSETVPTSPQPPTEDTNNSNNSNGQPLSALNYVLLFLLLLAVSIGTLAWLAVEGLTKDDFMRYFLLVILGLVVGTFTHGVMRSNSRLEGRKAGFVLQLGGPIVACFLTIYGGFHFPTSTLEPDTQKLKTEIIDNKDEGNEKPIKKETPHSTVLQSTKGDSPNIQKDKDQPRPQQVPTPQPNLQPIVVTPPVQVPVSTHNAQILNPQIQEPPSEVTQSEVEKTEENKTEVIPQEKVTFLIKSDHDINNIIITSDAIPVSPSVSGKGGKIITVHELPEGKYDIELITEHPDDPSCQSLLVEKKLTEIIMPANKNKCNRILQ